MADNFYKLSNSEFIIWMKNMTDVVQTNLALTGIDQAFLDEAKTSRQNLATNLGDKQTLEDNLSAKNQEIKFNRNFNNKKAAKIQGWLKLNENVLNSLIEQAGFNVDDGVKTSTAAVSPTDLVATGTSDGTNRLKWSRNGNKQGTLFMIEAKIGDSNTWVLIDTVTNSKYEHKNQTPGVKIQYRVKAKRGESISTASNTAVVYE
ncbi:hypothetical protein BH10ACI1_BH10ACI1_03380 [soil metagenome]